MTRYPSGEVREAARRMDPPGTISILQAMCWATVSVVLAVGIGVVLGIVLFGGRDAPRRGALPSDRFAHFGQGGAALDNAVWGRRLARTKRGEP